MNNNELASLIGTIIAVLPDIQPEYAKEQIYRAASKAVAEAGFGTTFMASAQNDLYKGFTAKRNDFEPILGMDEREDPKECGCPSCTLAKRLAAKRVNGVVQINGKELFEMFNESGVNSNPILEFFENMRKLANERQKKYEATKGKQFEVRSESVEQKSETDTSTPLGSGQN